MTESDSGAHPVVVPTTCGAVRGVRFAGVTTFLGIPFAAGTAGDGRFRAPAAHPGWSGVRDALAYGPAAPQPDARFEARTGLRAAFAVLQHPRVGNATEGLPTGEDCLNLNIWTPGVDPQARRPVLVWVHGGGFHAGSTGTQATQGAALAARGDLVVVSVGHRLGVFGFARLDLLDPDNFPDAGVLGQLDIIAGLRWIADNITAFGGDPGRVTVMGQSGGGMKITALLGMPAARGLFHRAVNCSGPGRFVQSPEEGLAAAEMLIRASGVAHATDLAGLPTGALVDAGLAAADLQAAATPPGQPPLGMMMFKPGLHARHLPTQPFGDDATQAPAGAGDVAMMFGYTTHEATLFLMSMPGYPDVDAAGLRAAVSRSYPERADRILTTYERVWGPEPAHLRLARVLTDASFRGGQWHLATIMSTSSAPVYLYHFDYLPDVLDGAVGAAHSMDVPFLFGTTDRAPISGTRPYRNDLSRSMTTALAAFVHGGDPSVDGQPAWRPFTGDTPWLMRFGDEIACVDATAERDAAVESPW